ncbi:MAG: hypothetical protein QNJ72_26235 [Pleurocapsa sp. MO_226.B13]|nr:hypothetical protein [Pleurocapsa sp. MO_226.B13]
MLTKDRLDKALTLVVPSASVRDHSQSDTVKLMESYGIIEKAKNAFLDREITFDEYLQLCELHQINVDSYMETIEHNLIKLKLI